MSVLIEGMTMPANCQECIALKIGDICFCGKKLPQKNRMVQIDLTGVHLMNVMNAKIR